MKINTYRAGSMQEALCLVRRELGPDAAVLHTREVRPRGLFSLFSGRRKIEVTASLGVNVPSRLPQAPPIADIQKSTTEEPLGFHPAENSAPHECDQRQKDEVSSQLAKLQAQMENLRNDSNRWTSELPDGLFPLFTDLIEADISEKFARQYVERC